MGANTRGQPSYSTPTDTQDNTSARPRLAPIHAPVAVPMERAAVDAVRASLGQPVEPDNPTMPAYRAGTLSLSYRLNWHNAYRIPWHRLMRQLSHNGVRLLPIRS